MIHDAVLAFVHWSTIIVAGIIGGYFIEDVKKSALLGLVGGIVAWSLSIARFVFSDYFGAVNAFINAAAGLPALPVMLIIGGILAMLGALIGAVGKKAFTQ